jgi:hypothetical protein
VEEGLWSLFAHCNLLCTNFLWVAGSQSYMSDAAMTLVAALIGGVAAGGCLNFIGMSVPERK